MLPNNFSQNKKLQRKIVTLLTVFALVVSSLLGQVTPAYASTADSKTAYTINLNSNSSTSTGNDESPTENMKDGAILHAWCWSFNTIKENMADIAAAGYTSVQTSPVSQCKVGNNGDLKFTNQWWYHYQPTDYKIGNYQLGTEEELKAMCTEAHKYGIRVIVDVIANHMTADYSAISDNVKNISNFFHTNTEITDWNSRYQVTQQALLSLYDNNTQNKNVQNYIKSFLNQCLADGVDGFRYDAAKHIELPSDDSSYAGDFWPTILDNDSEFQYGEILQDSISKDSEYANYMNVTASSYGYKLRSAIGSNDFSTSTLMSWDISVDPDKMVTWVESHDTYANSITDYGSSEWMNDEQLKLGWAVIAARSGGAPLFFSRPVGGGGQSWDNRFPEVTKVGDRGSDLFMDDEVAAVNKFRNVMDGESEYLRNPNGNTQVLMIERGDAGVVIVNANSYDYSLSSATKLADGTYTNHTDNNNVFTVSNGTITGTLPSRSVVVLYKNGPSVSISDSTKAFRTDSQTLTLNASNATKATYSINGGTSYLYDDGDTITIGAGDAYGTSYTIELRGIDSEGNTASKTYTFNKKDPNAQTSVYFEKPSSWGNTVYAYIYDDDSDGTSVSTNGEWPGVAMTYDSSTGYYKYAYNDSFNDAKVIFNDGTNQTPAANVSGYDIEDAGIYDVNGFTGDYVITTTSPSPSATVSTSPSPSVAVSPSPTVSTTPTASTTPTEATTIYFSKPSGWGSTIYAYVYDESGSSVVKNASWPGAKMTVNSDGYYTYSITNSTFSNDLSNTKVIFSDGSNQTPGSNQSGYDVVASGLYGESGLIKVITETTTSPSASVSPSTSVSPSPSATVTASPSVTPSTETTIYFSKPSGWGSNVYAYVYDESGSSVVKNASWPGEKMTLESTGYYSYAIDNATFSNDLSNAKVIFTDGSNQAPSAAQSGFAVVAGAYYSTSGIINTPSGDNTITVYYYTTSWSSPYIHYQIGSGTWTTAPGVKMSSTSNSNYYVATIDLGTATTLTACFNNGSGSWDSNSGKNYSFGSAGTYTVANGNVTSGSPL